tara:strand:+ start:255 stop:1052 length:798 start_codon:yes stop_codon:yes gene_type:complete
MEKNVWLYFDDGAGSGAPTMFHAKDLMSMVPYSDTKLQFVFKSLRNDMSAIHDTIVVNLKDANTHLDVIKNITRNINNTAPTFGGFICIADDNTTTGPEYITDNRQENGYITGIDSMNIQNTSTNLGASVSTTYVPSLAGVALPQGGYYTINSTNDNHIIILPKPVVGTVVYLNSYSENTNKYELRTNDPVKVGINDGVGANAESEIATNVALVKCECVSAGIQNGSNNGGYQYIENDATFGFGNWVCTQYTDAGVVSTLTAASA